MKKTNKIISILLVLAMLLSMAPLSLTASAADIIASGSSTSVKWTIDSDGLLTITGTNYKYPPKVWNNSTKVAPWDDYRMSVKKAVFVNCDDWTDVPTGTFRGHSNLTDVTLPPNITRIGEYAFTSAAIRSIVLPDSVTLIDYDAFSLCKNLTYINIPDGVETIRGNAFKGCTALKAISIPDSVTELGSSYTFSDCKSLTAVRLSNNITSLGSSVFYNCPIETLIIPAKVTELGVKFIQNSGVARLYYQGTAEPTTYNPGYNNDTFAGTLSAMNVYVPEAYSNTTMGIKKSWGGTVKTVNKINGYNVNPDYTANGVVTVDTGIAAQGDTVNITLVPYGGYEVESVSVKQGETDIAVTGSGVNYSFTMPAGDVTVSAVFKESLHIHDFTYSAEGATLKAVCSNTDGKCNYPVQQITANNSESYSFNKDYTRPVTFEGVIDGYYPEATYTMNGEPIEGEPYYPGEYVATLTKGDATLSVSYSITKATPSSSLFNYAKPSNLTYDGTAKYGTVTLKDDVEGLGDFTVIYRLGSSKGEITEPIKAGKYYMRALVEEGEYYKAGEVSLTNFTISCDHTACGTDYVPNNDGTHNETYGCGTVKTSNTDCSFADGVCEYCEYACLHEGQTGAVCELCKKSLHTHSFTYTASGDTITAICANTDGACPDTNGGSFTLQAPSSLIADGKAKQFTYTGSISGVTPKITYSQEPIPKTAGTYTVTMSITVDGTIYSVSQEYTILEGLYVTFGSNYITTTKTADWTPNLKAFNTSTGIHFLTSGLNNKNSVVNGGYTVQWYDAENKPLSGAPTDAGTYTIKVTLSDSLNGTCALQGDTLTYTINPLDLSTGMVDFWGWPNGQPRYNGQQQLPDATIGNSSYILPESSYTIEAIEGKNCTNAGTAYCLLKGTGGNVIGEKELSYYINMAQIDLPEPAKRTYTYDGTSKATDFSGETLPTGYASIEALYWYKAGSNTRLSEAPSDVGEYEVYVKYTPTDAVNYQTMYRKEAFEIKAATPVVTAPTAVSGLVYNGEAQALITAGSVNGGEMQFSTDGVEYSATIPTATNAGDYTVYYKVVGDANYNDTEPATVSVTIKTKDISDASIILGDALTYTGEEQTQSVTSVTVDGLDVTYDISGNKATNVGVYLLTVTGNGNFSGEAKIAYEIAVDMNGVDFDTLHSLNVKSTDKEKIEYIFNQVDNAVRNYASEDKNAEWDLIKSNCVELLEMIENVANHLEWFKEDLAEYDIETVTSDDADDLEGLYESNAQWLYDFADNYTEEEIKEFSDTLDGVSKLQKRVSDVAKEITRITDAVNGYDKATVKSSDKADLEQLLADINALTTGNNITDSERADLLALADTVNELLAVISDTANEINRINDAVDAYDIETVTSADKSDIEKLIEDIKVLTDGGNITDAEREQLNGNNATLNALLDKIGATADEIARIENAVNGYDEATVKSTDKADIEQLIEDIKALTDGQNITDEERTNLENLDAKADALLAKIAETKSEYDRVIAAANGYDEATVTSADKDTLVQLNEDIYALALTDNVTAEELENLENAHDKILGLIDKLTGISDEIKRIIEAVDKYVFESVKSSDKADIQQLIADIKALLDTQNITADERTLLEGADETCDKLVAKIDETVAEINRINDATNAYDINTVTSADKADIEKLIEDIKALTDGDNITDTEREQLDGNETTLSALLDKIGATADEIARIENAVNSYDEATVKSTDKADLEQLVEDIKALTDATNITAEEKAALEALDATADSLIKKIDDTAAEIARIDEAVNAYDEETVKSSDIQALGKLIEDIKALTDGDNITEDEKAALEADDAAVDALVEKLTEVAEEIKRVDEAVKSYDEETIKSSDSEELAQLKEDIQALIDSTNTTENEKTVLGEMIADIEALEDKIDETAKEIERIENAVNGYDKETVKSSDEEAINKLKEDIQTLIDSGNVTEEEISGLEDTKADADALTDKIDETQAEIDRINDAVNSYTEDTVKSTDTEAIEQLKEDIQNLIDGGNVTDEEISSLEDTKDKADNLTDKIAETENQLEEIGNIENGYDSEKVTSDDKAAIEEAIAEIEAVNPDNLTDEQKAEYEKIKAEFEALLDEIEAADKAVSDIGIELEMFDEDRVTIFWEDDIEALKAKIDELLADENMGTAEKAKLNEYKAQAEKLIEIINTPKEYISCRFFYFIWDCLTWKYNGILWLFSNLFGC